MSKWKRAMIILAVAYGEQLPIEIVREALGL